MSVGTWFGGFGSEECGEAGASGREASGGAPRAQRPQTWWGATALQVCTRYCTRSSSGLCANKLPKKWSVPLVASNGKLLFPFICFVSWSCGNWCDCDYRHIEARRKALVEEKKRAVRVASLPLPPPNPVEVQTQSVSGVRELLAHVMSLLWCVSCLRALRRWHVRSSQQQQQSASLSHTVTCHKPLWTERPTLSSRYMHGRLWCEGKNISS